MQKIPTIFKRGADPRYVTDEVNHHCLWVFAGEGVPTRKFDGTCVMLDAYGNWWNRREIREGKTMPKDAIDLGTDPATGKTMCWVPNTDAGHRKNLVQAIKTHDGSLLPGTYELVAPNIDTRAGRNPEGVTAPALHSHGDVVLPSFGTSALIEMCRKEGWEGVVWHHPDGRKAKLKVRDYPQVG